ncbi:protein of unknown function [Candidatus Hydrogenisulfobacillus filiaventi]|uniref:Uncharacterized protein n=1 Tax=Candidatus Hydrogenisulfobacillus filiaventi TaxID=2707344 RepID=A0A6F8ZD18_9FIRM|nr:hypothetical protein [Bacillota bacterium]CAB1127768.1 protein of unknown function [Candidatus Hydrogenisulfobacillus filiaventi]
MHTGRIRAWQLTVLHLRVAAGRWCLVHAPGPGARLWWSRQLDRWILALYRADPALQPEPAADRPPQPISPRDVFSA